MKMSILSSKWMIWSVTISFALSTVLPYSGLGRASSIPDGERAYEELLSRLDRASVALERLEEEIDRSQFDVVEKTKALGRDVERIFVFVRDEICYEPYCGVLRGATGTLMTGAGNSADKSVLLARMLEVAGYKTRFVSGRLDQKTVKKLLSEFFNDDISQADEMEYAVLENTIKTVSEDLSIDRAQLERGLEERYNELEDLKELLWNRVETDHKLISSLLKEHGVRLGTGVSLEELGREAAEHYWVRYKDSSGKWFDLDPSVPGSGIGEAPGKAQESLDKLPDELFHRLSVVSTLRTGPSGEGSEIKVADHTLIKKSLRTSDMFGKAITYMNVPETKPAMGKDARTSLIKMYNDVREFTATFRVGGKVILGKSFDLEGNVFEKKEDYRIKLAKQQQKTMHDALDALSKTLEGEDAEKEPAPKKGRVLGQWLTYSITSPGGAGKPPVTKEYRRFLLRHDEVVGWSPAGEKTATIGVRKKTDLTTALMQTQQFTLLTGLISPAFLVWNQLRDSIESRPLVEMLLREAFDKKGGPKENDTPLTGQRPMQLLTYALNTETTFSQAMEARFPGLRAYRARPSLVLWKEHIEMRNPDDIKLVRGFDIVDNPVRVATHSAGDRSAISVSIMQGITETAMEHFLVSQPEGSEAIQKTVSASSVLNSVVKSGIKLNVLDKGPGGLDALAKLKLSAAVKSQMAADIKEGYVVIAPDSAVGTDELKEYAWWRIDPATGKTLGMMPGPAGQALTEAEIEESMILMIAKAIKTFGNVVTVFIAAWTFALCVASLELGKFEGGEYAGGILVCILLAIAAGKGIGGSWSSMGWALFALLVTQIWLMYLSGAFDSPVTQPSRVPQPPSNKPPWEK